MKKSLLFYAVGIIVTLPCTILITPATEAQSEASQIIITQYTGSDSPRNKAEFIYRVAFKRNGNTIYVGSKTYAKRVGRYQGTITQKDFNKLASLLASKSYTTEPVSYNMYKDPENKEREVGKTTYEVLIGNRKKTVIVYEDSGPKRYKQAGHIWYGLIWKIPWQKVSSSDAIDE